MPAKTKKKKPAKNTKPKKTIKKQEEELELEEEFDEDEIEEEIEEEVEDDMPDEEDSEEEEEEFDEDFDLGEDDEDEESYEEVEVEKPSWGSRIKYAIIWIIIGIFVGGGLALYYNQQQDKNVMLQQEMEQKELTSRTVEEKVADILRDPQTDTPIVKSVKDISLIEAVPIYQFAQNGDTVLVYKEMTVIYDEARDKIVSVVPQNVLKQTASEDTSDEELADDEASDDEVADEDSEDNDSTSSVDPAEVAVEVRNGTQTPGLAGKTTTQITDEFGYDVVAANAGRNTYVESIIIDLSDGTLATEVENIRKQLDISKVLSEVPSDEKETTADILVILGE